MPIKLPIDPACVNESDVIVCAPPVASFLQFEGKPIFVTDKKITEERDSFVQRRPITLHDCLEHLVPQYFDGVLLDEACIARKNARAVRRQLKAHSGSIVEVPLPMTTHEVLSSVLADVGFEVGDDGELVASWEDRDEKEQLAILTRLIGQRVFAFHNLGSNNVTLFRVIMALSTRGCSSARWVLDEGTVYVKFANHTFNINGEMMRGAAITPANPKPKNPDTMRFSLTSLNWVPAATVEDPVALRNIDQSDRPFGTNFTGMDGSELAPVI